MTATLTQALYDRLTTDGELVTMLSTFADAPAVFTVEPIPEAAALPYVVSVGAVGQSPFDTKTTLGRDLIRDVRCYAAATSGVDLIESIAERVYLLLHKYKINNAILTSASGPTVLPTDSTIYGRLVSLRWVGTLQKVS